MTQPTANVDGAATGAGWARHWFCSGPDHAALELVVAMSSPDAFHVCVKRPCEFCTVTRGPGAATAPTSRVLAFRSRQDVAADRIAQKIRQLDAPALAVVERLVDALR